ncbi:MAG: RidA family protein [Deltaproteobacteria bacterium]
MSRVDGAKQRQAVATAAAPAAIGPYSQAMRVGSWLFCSGQVGIDPESGSLVEGGFAAEARRVFENLGAVLQEAGAGFDQVVKVTAYLTDLGNFAELNDIYAGYFTPPYPARAAVGVASLPKGASVEIELIAVFGD